MSVPKSLMPHQKATLLQFMFQHKKLPHWAKDEADILAAICGKSRKWAVAAYERAVHAGYMGKNA